MQLLYLIPLTTNYKHIFMIILCHNTVYKETSLGGTYQVHITCSIMRNQRILYRCIVGLVVMWYPLCEQNNNR